MLSHVKIDSLGLIKTLSQHIGFGGDIRSNINVTIHCFFRDPVEKNFYRIKVIKNDSISAEDYRLFDDQYTNGQETDLPLGDEEDDCGKADGHGDRYVDRGGDLSDRPQ